MVVLVFFFSPAGLTTMALSFREKRDRLRHHFMFASALPLFRLPLTIVEASVDNGPITFTQVLAAILGLLAKGHDIHVTHFIFLIIALSKPSVHRQPEIGDGSAAGGVPKFRVSRQVPDENDFIEPHHLRIPPFQPQPLETLLRPLARSKI